MRPRASGRVPRLPLLAVLGALLAGGSASPAAAQSEAGLAARQTIPFVIASTDANNPQSVLRSTDIEVHNPHKHALRIEVTYFGAIPSTLPGRLACEPLDIDGLNTRSVPLRSICPLGPGNHRGRLELRGRAGDTVIDPATGGPRPGAPSDDTFLAGALIRWDAGSGLMRVEGFPQGGLSGARSLATGLRSGSVDGDLWSTSCYAAALDESVPVRIRLLDAKGGELGKSFDILDPSAALEMTSFSGSQLSDVFSALGVPPGSYSEVSAEFTTISGSGQAAFGFCRLTNLSRQSETFVSGKFLDDPLESANRDQGRQHAVSVSRDRLGWPYQLRIGSNLADHEAVWLPANYHLAYFQHPDRIYCSLDTALKGSYVGSVFPPYLQMRLIDPDDQVVATSEFDTSVGSTVLKHETGEKSSAAHGRNGRWLLEVAPSQALQSPPCGGGLCSGGTAPSVEYTLSCSSGNGHGQLDRIHVSECGATCRRQDGWNCAFGPLDRPENGLTCP